MERLDTLFFARGAQNVAKELIGKLLIRSLDGIRISGLIVETEAYCDADEPDLACHGDRVNQGLPTPRTEVMFGPPGHAYVYFTYGKHWMFNVVTGEIGQANAVLIRALEPVEGEDSMAKNRPNRPRELWTNGPAKLAQALDIDGSFNGIDLCDDRTLVWIEDSDHTLPRTIATGPRIGLGKTPEPWLSIPWRYWLKGSKFVSR